MSRQEQRPGLDHDEQCSVHADRVSFTRKALARGDTVVEERA
jgi:hypothetical protein